MGADSRKCHLFFYHEEHEGLEDMHWVPKLDLGNQQITLFDKSLNSLPFIIFMSFMVIKTSYKHCTASAPSRILLGAVDCDIA
jgi:hypothetical protein